MGAKAPALVIDRWIKGDAAPSFEAGKVYVIEFWATWCGPCIAGIGHLTQLQAELREKGLTVIGVTTPDPKNELSDVMSMVTMRDDGMNYTVAFDQGNATWTAYMTASGRNGIPASYVVGKDGTIEYMGHPQLLDLVLPKVLDGTWDRTAGMAEVFEADGLHNEIDRIAKNDPKTALEKFNALESRWPTFARQFLLGKYDLQRRLGDAAGAKESLDRAFEHALAQKDVVVLRGMAGRALGRKTEPGALDDALRFAQAASTTSKDRDAVSLRLLAKIFEAQGDRAKAIETLKKALDASDARTRPRLQAELEAMEKGESAPAGR